MSFYKKYYFLLLIFHFYIINYLLSFVSDGYVKIGKQFGRIKIFQLYQYVGYNFNFKYKYAELTDWQ